MKQNKTFDLIEKKGTEAIQKHVTNKPYAICKAKKNFMEANKQVRSGHYFIIAENK